MQCILYRRFAFVAQLIKLGMQIQILAHAQLFIQRKRLRHITHAHFHVGAARINRFTQQFRRAFGGFQQTGEHFHGGGFATAVAAQKAENLALGNGKADLINGGKIAKTLGQAMRFNRRRQIGIGRKRCDIQNAFGLLFFRQHFDISFFQHFGVILF